MKVGDLVRCKVIKDPDIVGVVVSIGSSPSAPHGINPLVGVLTDGRVHMWGAHRLEVVNEARR